MVARKISQSANFKESVRYVLRQGRHVDKAAPVLWGVINLAPDERNADRLAWEMHQTALYADRLKELAGIPKKHRKRCTTPVLHRFFSYGDYVPSADEIRSDVASHLTVLGLDRQECVWACHNDNGHWHVHLIVNKIDATTGLAVKLKDDFSKADAWRLQWDAAHPEVIADNDNNRTEPIPTAKDRGEWAERRLIDRETFAEAARLLHGQLNQQQRSELKAFCKAKAAEWVTAARDQTATATRKTYARSYSEDRYFTQPKRHYVQGYWTTQIVTKVSKRGNFYTATKRRYVHGHIRFNHVTWFDRYLWARLNADRFRAVGLQPPGLWACTFSGSFLDTLRKLHAAEKSAAKETAKRRRRDIIDGHKADALAQMKRGHRAAHDAITKERIRDAAVILMGKTAAHPSKQAARRSSDTHSPTAILMAKKALPRRQQYRNRPGAIQEHSK